MTTEPIRLRDLAIVVRSKNAGPFRITFDILFKTKASFEEVRAAGAITCGAVARAFGVPESQISSLFEIPMCNAFKVTLHRPITQGAIGETDVYGCQQHVPLLYLPIRGG